MIGEIVTSFVPYYDKGETKYKSRPILIIGDPIGKDKEYLALPISRLPNKEFYVPEYDILLDPKTHQELSLTDASYVRCHKPISVHRNNIDFRNTLGNLKESDKELFKTIMYLYAKRAHEVMEAGL